MAVRKLLGLSGGKIVTPQSGEGVFLGKGTCTRPGGIHYQPEIAGGSIAAPTTGSQAYVDTEGAAATDDLDNITGGSDGMLLFIVAATNSRTVVLRDGVGNLRLAGNFSLDDDEDSITLIKRGTNWLELSRANSGV